MAFETIRQASSSTPESIRKRGDDRFVTVIAIGMPSGASDGATLDKISVTGQPIPGGMGCCGALSAFSHLGLQSDIGGKMKMEKHDPGCLLVAGLIILLEDQATYGGHAWM